MILTCSNCNARFLVNAAALQPAGREVRCGRCRHQWFAEPEEPEAPKLIESPEKLIESPKPSPPPPPLPPEPPVAIEPRPIPRGSNLPAIPKQKRSRVGVLLGWLLLLVVVVALGIAAAERETVMALFPESRPFYGAVGFEVPAPGDGLKIVDVTSSRIMQEGVPVLICEGRISNVSHYKQEVPTLRGALRDSEGRELQSWTFTVPTTSLSAGDSIPFRTEIRQPAASATELSITFVTNP